MFLKDSVPPVVSFQIFLLIDGNGARSEGWFLAAGTGLCVQNVLSSRGCSGLLAGNTGLIVQLIVAPLCLWPDSPPAACRNASYGLKSENAETPVESVPLFCIPATIFITDDSLFSHVTSVCPSLPLPPPDKNFEDDDSVDGGRSSSSSKGASLSGRKPVSMGSFRRPSSASSAKSAGQSRRITNLICTKSKQHQDRKLQEV